MHKAYKRYLQVLIMVPLAAQAYPAVRYSSVAEFLTLWLTSLVSELPQLALAPIPRMLSARL